MIVAEARAQAKEWVDREASGLPGFVGAFLTGSTKWRAPEAIHSRSSDVDLRVVVDHAGTAQTWPKFRYRDILLEAAASTRSELGSEEELLSNPHLGGSLWHPVLLADPSGALAELGRRVTSEFPRREWIAKRRDAVRDLAVGYLERIDAAPAYPEQVTCWLFGTSATTLVLLTAGLRNLTVRRRYAESRSLLEGHGRLDFHEEMLSWMGCADLPAQRVRSHLSALAAAFDGVDSHVDPSFRFAADLRPDARSIAIDGSRELIDAGLHREAAYWLVATYSRCLQGLRGDAPDPVRDACMAGFGDILADLGIESFADLRARAQQVLPCIPRLEEVADAITDGTPEARD